METSRQVIRYGQILADIIGENEMRQVVEACERILMDAHTKRQAEVCTFRPFDVAASELLRSMKLVVLDMRRDGCSFFTLTEEGRVLTAKRYA